jgi:Tol biopolymer transport system component
MGTVYAAVVVGILVWWRPWSQSKERGTFHSTGSHASAPAVSASYRFIAPETWSAASAAEEWPAFSPDGKELVYSMTVDGFRKLFVRDVARTQPPRQITEGPADDIQAAWSPSGKWALFDRTTPVGGDLFMLRNLESDP